jgi:hypothetical protein
VVFITVPVISIISACSVWTCGVEASACSAGAEVGGGVCATAVETHKNATRDVRIRYFMFMPPSGN